MKQFKAQELTQEEQWLIKRGYCPWCKDRLDSSGKTDVCHNCKKEITGHLTIED